MFLWIRLDVGVTIGCILHIVHSVLLPWIQTSQFKKTEIVFNRVKEFKWVYSFAGKKSGFCSFKKKKEFSWESDVLDNSRWFCGYKDKMMGNLY